MSSPDCKRQKLADDINSVAKMSNVSPNKDAESKTENGTSTASTSKELTVIDGYAQEFEDVASMDGFVDRTMLIEELLQKRPTCVMMFSPSKFGKTINLKMIRLFCEIEDKNTKTKEDVAKDPTMEELRSNPSENMKVFLRQFGDTKYEECLILKRENFVIQHFGRHPVVSFNFKRCSAKSQSDAILVCAKQVYKAYLEHKYLRNSKEFQSDDPEYAGLKQTCTKWINYSDDALESLSLDKVADGLENLIESLRVHWGRLPVFLVDEVDKPCVFAMENELSEKQVRQIGNTITYVVCSILKPEGKQLKLQAALLTGICKFKNSGLSTLDNTLTVYYLSDDRFSKYYGLTAQEVESLVRKFHGPQGEDEIAKILRDINEKYNGYYQQSVSGDNKEYARYCLFSVLNYIKNKDTKDLCFWSDGGFLNRSLVPVLKKSKDIMSNIQKLLYGDSATIEIEYQKSGIDVQCLLGLFREEMKPPTLNVVFNFFLQQGYLAYNVEKSKENVGMNKDIYVRIPNLEIKSIYENMFMEYYKTLPEEITSKLASCGEIFESLPTIDSTQFQNSLNQLCKELKCVFRFMGCSNEHTVCGHLLAILMRDARYEKGQMEHTVQYFDNNKPCWVHIDVWGRLGNFAVIIEVKFNAAANGEPGQIGSAAKSSLAAAEDIVQLLPGKKKTESRGDGKAGTGRDLEMLKNFEIKHYVLIGLAVDADYTPHMLVFRDTSDWKNVIQVNPENHVAELISTHLK